MTATDATRNELIWRIRLIVENDFLRRMMNAPYTKFDMAKEMDAGKIIIINNSQKLLGIEGAEFFGRLFLAQVWNAATARSDRTGRKTPVFVYIDEAQLVIRRDEMVAKIIDECRSQRISFICAHQRIQLIESPNVLSALSNCAIRMSNADEEADYLAPRLRTELEHLMSMKRGGFAVFVRDLVTHAFTMKIHPINLSSWPKLSPEQIKIMMEQMALRYGYDETHKPPETEGLRANNSQPAEPDKPTVPQITKTIPEKSDPSTPAPWARDDIVMHSVSS